MNRMHSGLRTGAVAGFCLWAALAPSHAAETSPDKAFALFDRELKSLSGDVDDLSRFVARGDRLRKQKPPKPAEQASSQISVMIEARNAAYQKCLQAPLAPEQKPINFDRLMGQANACRAVAAGSAAACESPYAGGNCRRIYETLILEKALITGQSDAAGLCVRLPGLMSGLDPDVKRRVCDTLASAKDPAPICGEVVAAVAVRGKSHDANANPQAFTQARCLDIIGGFRGKNCAKLKSDESGLEFYDECVAAETFSRAFAKRDPSACEGNVFCRVMMGADAKACPSAEEPLKRARTGACELQRRMAEGRDKPLEETLRAKSQKPAPLNDPEAVAPLSEELNATLLRLQGTSLSGDDSKGLRELSTVLSSTSAVINRQEALLTLLRVRQSALSARAKQLEGLLESTADRGPEFAQRHEKLGDLRKKALRLGESWYKAAGPAPEKTGKPDKG